LAIFGVQGRSISQKYSNAIATQVIYNNPIKKLKFNDGYSENLTSRQTRDKIERILPKKI